MLASTVLLDAGPLTVSVVIPAYNAAATLECCLASLAASTFPVLETIVVDDGSSDGSAEIARRRGAIVLSTGVRGGPARARNRGARAARGGILLFLDADVAIHPDTIERAVATLAGDASVAAVIGSYDDAPAAPNFLSQYKNLQHCFVHRNGRREACTFWSGCGAIRRPVFLQAGGFTESYALASIEDVELGYRLVRAGRRIVLDKLVLAAHLKRWTLPALLRSDIFERAVPWTRLIVDTRCLPDDLNVRWSQRVSALLALALVAVLPAGMLRVSAVPYLWAALALWLSIVAGNLSFYRFLASKRGLLFAVMAMPFHFAYLVYSAVVFVLAGAWYSLRLRSAAPKNVCQAEADR